MEVVANTSRRHLAFSEGDFAWLSTAHLPIRSGARKLAAKWAGPYRVMDKVAREAYRLELPASWKVHPVFHTSQLKECTGSSHTNREAAVLLDDAEPEFEVERFVDMRIVRGLRQFLVKWKGYGEFENSWEPESNLGNSMSLLNDFVGSRSRVLGTRLRVGPRAI